jgi:NADPH:quinone reductase-like Zn-dependent oxidoreductase
VNTVKAIRYYRYGGPDVLSLQDVEVPAVGDHDVLVRVRAASVNPLDSLFMRGEPYLARARTGLSRPRSKGLGADMAGQVEAVGKGVTEFRPGDEVFGSRSETFAEYVSIPEDGVLLTKPASLTFEQAATVGVAAFSALQALRDKGHIRPEQKVLVNGAAGGVGTFAVQIAKALGAEVTGVCSTRNVEMVASIGADHVVDYTRQDFTQNGQRYDLLVDTIANRTPSECRRVLAPKGILVGVGGSPSHQFRMLLLSSVVSQTMAPLIARQRREDLVVLRDLVEDGRLTPVIDRTYPLEEVPEAIRYLEHGHARGKVVITV